MLLFKGWFHLCYSLCVLRQNSNLNYVFSQIVCVKMLCPVKQSSGVCINTVLQFSDFKI